MVHQPVHLVRWGTLAEVAGFRALDERAYPRGTRVVVRTPRGLEIGEVLSPPGGHQAGESTVGELLRAMTPQDELLAERLERHRHAAYEACSAELAARGLGLVLVDVEQLFDGRSLVFYFLGDLSDPAQAAEVSALTDELAETYEAQAAIRPFAELLTAGCGPGCGTEAAAGQGCTSCATGCAVAGLCHPGGP